MGLRDKITRLERATRREREAEEAKAIFMSSMARLRALAGGEPLPPKHPRASDPRVAGTFLYGDHVIVDRDGEPITGPVEDLSKT